MSAPVILSVIALGYFGQTYILWLKVRDRTGSSQPETPRLTRSGSTRPGSGR